MLNESLAEEVILFFQKYLSFYKEFFQLETDKFNDISLNKVSKIDSYVKSEEVFMLKSRGLEQERERLIAKTGTSVTTFRELIPLFESPQREQIQGIFDEFSEVLLNLKEINLRCNYLTELRLHRIENDLKKLEKRPDLQKIYDAQAREGKPAPSFLSKKI